MYPAYDWEPHPKRRRIPAEGAADTNFKFTLVDPDHECFNKLNGIKEGTSASGGGLPAETRGGGLPAETLGSWEDDQGDYDAPGPPPGRPADFATHKEPPGAPSAGSSGGRLPANTAAANRARSGGRLPANTTSDEADPEKNQDRKRRWGANRPWSHFSREYRTKVKDSLSWGPRAPCSQR